jgi:hypothetical protein
MQLSGSDLSSSEVLSHTPQSPHQKTTEEYVDTYKRALLTLLAIQIMCSVRVLKCTWATANMRP